MSTAAISTPILQRKPGTYDRRFYSGIAIAMAITVLAGFAPTYFAAMFGSAPLHTFSGRPFTLIVHLHGALFSAWVLLFVVQTSLIAAHRVAWHRTLGIFGGVLAAAMWVVGCTAAIQGTQRGSAPPGMQPLQFLIIPLADVTTFAIFVALALWYRKNKEAHKRLMLLAFTCIMAAPVARLPHVVEYGPLLFYPLSFTFLFAGVIYDWLSRRRIHPAYAWGGTLLVLSVPLRMVLSTTQAWHAVASFLTQQ